MTTQPTCNAARPELLLPAGDFSAVTAAVQNGADAVYLGGREFSARQNAANFDEDGLAQAVSYCHARGVKVYQTLNTLLFDSQFQSVLRAVEIGCAFGVDAFIVQDWGLFALLAERCPEMRVHASTQATVHTLRGARTLARLGVKRVVLARELSLEEIRVISENAGIETEVFVHGALCMSVSGQCYMSGMIGGRSGNRGCCAGTCRLPWKTRGGLPDGENDYALSLKDLCLARQIGALAEAGVSSLKVEGRMKRPEYVAAAARAYRLALDGEEGAALREALATLQAVFSRSGFTDGYFTGRRGAELFGHRQKADVTAATPKLLKALENSYKTEHGRVPLDLRLTARAGEALRLSASDGEGHTAEAVGEAPAKAQNKAATAESAMEQLEKLGGTIFCAGGISADVGEGLFLPASLLNDLRREVCASITAQREALSPIPFLREREDAAGPTGPVGPVGPAEVWGRFTRFDQIPPEESGRLDRLCLPLEEAAAHAAELEGMRERILLEPDRVLFGREDAALEQLEGLRKQGFRHLLCNNLSHLALAEETGMEAHGGPLLNCTNSRAAAQLGRLGAVSQTLSFELNLQDAKKIRAALPLGLVVYGHLPLMLLRACPLRAGTSCAECGGKGFLTDRTGMRFPVACSRRRYVEVLNGNVLWMGDRMDEARGFAFHCFYFTGESREECAAILEGYRNGAPAPERFTRGLYYRNI